MERTDHSLRLGFAGTPAFAAEILQTLIRAGNVPRVIYTQPDRPSGRGRRTQRSPVKLVAEAHGIPLQQPTTLKHPGAPKVLAGYRLDVLVVAAYGLILPEALLRVPAKGCINVHASLLPRWRGAAPIERCLMAGDAETGVSIMKMDPGLDTGPVYETRTLRITGESDAPALERELAELGAAALLRCLNNLDQIKPEPQPEAGVTYAPKLTSADAAIAWGDSAISIERKVRALKGRMPAFARCGDARLRVLVATAAGDGKRGSARPGTIIEAGKGGISVACGQGVLRITELQLNVGKGHAMSAAAALNGYPQLLSAGCMLHDGKR